MKKLLFILPCLCIISCSSPDDDNANNELMIEEEMETDLPNDFSFALDSSTNSVVLDQEIIVAFSSTDPVQELEVSTDNFETSTLFNLAGASESEICVSFRESGSRNLDIRAQSLSNVDSESSLSFNVALGAPVKITGVRVYSFFNINETWDTEFSEDDPNRFADVLVFLGKEDCSYQGGNANTLHLTSIIENVSEELFWDLNDLNIYSGLDKEVRIDVLDDDPEVVNYEEGVFVSVIEDGTGNAPVFKVSDYMVEKPESIRFTEDQENGYDIEIYLQWIE